MTNSKKVVLISGSTSGIGKVVAGKFHNYDYTVIQNSRNSINKQDLLGVMHIKGDVTNYDNCLEIIKSVKAEFGRLDVLVCNVGSGAEIGLNVLPQDRWSHFLGTNLLSATYIVNSALPLLLKSKGNVVAVSSICGSNSVMGAPMEYSVAKAALNMYVKSMAFRYGKSGVRFNAVSPGNVMFEGSTWHQKIKKNKSLINKFIREKVPMGTFIEPEAVAEAILFLANNESKFTTGMVLNVDGGQSL